ENFLLYAFEKRLKTEMARPSHIEFGRSTKDEVVRKAHDYGNEPLCNIDLYSGQNFEGNDRNLFYMLSEICALLFPECNKMMKIGRMKKNMNCCKEVDVLDENIFFEES
ncbi:hypothetical protein ACJX0J_012165, partial [Zea mays]